MTSRADARPTTSCSWGPSPPCNRWQAGARSDIFPDHLPPSIQVLVMTLRIRHKVILPALAIIVVLLAPAAYSVYSIYLINVQTKQLSQVSFPGSLASARMRRLLEDMKLYVELAPTSTSPE